jgi:hypothetical protein
VDRLVIDLEAVTVELTSIRDEQQQLTSEQEASITARIAWDL